MRHHDYARGIIALAIAAAVPSLATAQGARTATGASQRYDILITGGQVYDGTGNPWFYADIGIRGDRIVAIGKLEGATAARVIDAKGRIVTPGSSTCIRTRTMVRAHAGASGIRIRSAGLRPISSRRE